MTVLTIISFIPIAGATPSTLDVKKQAEIEMRRVVEPIIEQYCHEQCRIIHIESEVDVAIDDLTTPGFEDGGGKVSLAAASGKIKLLTPDLVGVSIR